MEPGNGLIAGKKRLVNRQLGDKPNVWQQSAVPWFCLGVCQRRKRRKEALNDDHQGFFLYA
ncbi:hypothetical protein [Gorillibacterium massiliense]|uniref:hypothetical protein n=1 Tax=Gorillibacterium massiliense TaxID=1280390 RepID=UPI0004AF3A3B|nr:hypothetical protein [Gorillibacterium massiliense]